MSAMPASVLQTPVQEAQVEDIPTALAAVVSSDSSLVLSGFIAGIGTTLRLYTLGKKKPVVKCELAVRCPVVVLGCEVCKTVPSGWRFLL